MVVDSRLSKLKEKVTISSVHKMLSYACVSGQARERERGRERERA